VISPGLLIGAAHTSEQEAVDKQAGSPLPTTMSILEATHCHAGQPHLYTCLSAKVNGWETHVHAGHSLNFVLLVSAILNHCATQAQ